MSQYLAPAHLALSAIILLWNVLLAGRIARVRHAPPAFAALSALGGLLIVPALLVELATSSIQYGRALHAIDWLWPAIIVLVAAQALYATTRRLVSPLIGAPIALYDLLLAAGAVTSYAFERGLPVPSLLLLLPIAERGALGIAAGSMALASPLYLYLPILAPAFQSRWRASAITRMVLAALAATVAGLTIAQLWNTRATVASYARFGRAPLTERPAGDFTVGLKLFPDLGGGPPPVALRNDLALADTLGIGAISVVIEPAGATRGALDSLARSVDELRRGGARLIVALGYRSAVNTGVVPPGPLDEEARLDAIRRIATRLRPDYLLPAVDPYGLGVRAVGRLPVERWRAYLTAATRVAHAVDRRIKVGVATSSYTPLDSALYAWAAGADSPLDVVGFAFAPGRSGARLLAAQTGAAERWLRSARSTKEHWVWSSRAFPLAHGERSQEHAIAGTLAWATRQRAVKGLVVADAGDYLSPTGLRAPDGRLRRVVPWLRRAIRAIRESEESAGVG